MFFLKKRTKKPLSHWSAVLQLRAAASQSFCFFFSKKEALASSIKRQVLNH
jgi:hypothetical protein